MDFKMLVDEINTYAANSFKFFTVRFTEKRWDDKESEWILRKNETCFAEIKILFMSEKVTLSLSIWKDDAYKELKQHEDFIKNNYGINVGYNRECPCKIEKDIDWNNVDAKVSTFDWLIMNAQMLQDIADKYLSEYEEKGIRIRQEKRVADTQKIDKAVDINKNTDYETKKVFAETHRRTGVRYKIIHRKSQNRYEIWSADKGKRSRVNNSNVEKIKHDKEAMIQYVKENLLK